MEITLRFTDDFKTIIISIVGFIIFCVITYYYGKYYVDRQKREAEEAQRIMDEMNQNQTQDDDPYEE